MPATVSAHADALSSTFQAMADPARRAMLARLASGAMTVGDLARPLEMTAPAVSHHLKVLERAGLIGRTARGQHRLISLKPERLSAAAGWIGEVRRFWDESFARLDDELARQAQSDKGERDE